MDWSIKAMLLERKSTGRINRAFLEQLVGNFLGGNVCFIVIHMWIS
jgi:hypothetical protein